MTDLQTILKNARAKAAESCTEDIAAFRMATLKAVQSLGGDLDDITWTADGNAIFAGHLIRFLPNYPALPDIEFYKADGTAGRRNLPALAEVLAEYGAGPLSACATCNGSREIHNQGAGAEEIETCPDCREGKVP